MRIFFSKFEDFFPKPVKSVPGLDLLIFQGRYLPNGLPSHSQPLAKQQATSSPSYFLLIIYLKPYHLQTSRRLFTGDGRVVYAQKMERLLNQRQKNSSFKSVVIYLESQWRFRLPSPPPSNQEKIVKLTQRMFLEDDILSVLLCEFFLFFLWACRAFSSGQFHFTWRGWVTRK